MRRYQYAFFIGLILSFCLLVGCEDYKSSFQITEEKAISEVQTESPNDQIDSELVQIENELRTDTPELIQNTQESQNGEIISMTDIPAYSGYACVEINGNIPFFTDSDKVRTDSFEIYSDLDSLGRCQVAYANICQEIEPTEKRGEIGQIRPSGWHTVKYNDIIDGNYLYNRCHLIGYQLAGENANEKNLITGTRYLNVIGMLPIENAVDDYVDATNNHVLYRVTPIFEGNNLVASGVLMEAYSVEDAGAGIEFCYYCYNVQPGIEIDYASGDSQEDTNLVSSQNQTNDSSQSPNLYYIVNKNNGTIHKSTCHYLPDEKNQLIFDSMDEVTEAGYSNRCKLCNP